MLDLRPVGYVTGLLVAALGAAMLLPMAVDIFFGNDHWVIFLESAVVTAMLGTTTALACANGVGERLKIQQVFLMTTGVWLTLPFFGAVPFLLGDPDTRVVDAFFEAMSGLTTTGATVFTDLETLPESVLLWRSMLQWFGGVGIIVVAMVFLPELRIGGMQIFRSESFGGEGKVLPRAAQIASSISGAYIALTVACYFAYFAVGMPSFHAFNHALTTVATGGFSTYDSSFGAFKGWPEYVAAIFMGLASLPFVRYVQLMGGSAGPLVKDPQIRGFFVIAAVLVAVVCGFRVMEGTSLEVSLRETLFNVISILTGTGYSSADYQTWGAFVVVLIFFTGLVGGCAGSTSCSIKVFRYQLLIATIRARIHAIHTPHGIFTPRYDGRPVSDEVLNSVMVFVVAFVVTLGVLSVLLSMTGLDLITSVSGAAAALANIGPGLGELIGPSGNFAPLNDAAKWLLAAAMLIGRLELMAVFAILTLNFWRA